MTPEQLTTLRAAVLADSALSAVGRNDTELARLLNLPSTFYGYRTDLTRAQIYRNASPEGTEWDWNVYRQQSPSEQGAWKEMFMDEVGSNTADFSRLNVRTGVDKIFQGSGAVALQRAHVANMAKRIATVAEKFLATGIGTAQSPGTFTFQGQVSINDIGEMWNQG